MPVKFFDRMPQLRHRSVYVPWIDKGRKQPGYICRPEMRPLPSDRMGPREPVPERQPPESSDEQRHIGSLYRARAKNPGGRLGSAARVQLAVLVPKREVVEHRIPRCTRVAGF